MMEKFSKAPWIIDTRLRVNDKFGQRIAQIYNDEDEESDANARLISAAPEMYEMLTQTCRDLCAIGHQCETCNALIGKLFRKIRGEND